ncbi:MAG: MerR family transcriptional regulator [Christensenellales bacterium]
MDTLRYYERIGLLNVARDKRSRPCVYTEHEIMRLLDFRKIKSLGFSNDELLGTFNRTDGLSHLKVFDESLEKLQAQVDELHARMRHVRGDGCPLQRAGPKERR